MAQIKSTLLGVTNKLLRHFGYEIRPRKNPDSDRIDTKSEFAELFEKTEGMISLREGNLLYQLARDIESGCILEIGSYRGRSTVALGRGSIAGNNVPVFAIDPHETFVGINKGKFDASDRGAFFKTMLETSCYHVVRLINLKSEQVAPTWSQKVGLLWIDGDHSYEGVKKDFDSWRVHLSEDATIAFHDSTTPNTGPYRLIDELVKAGTFKIIQQTGTITLLKNA